MISGQFDGTDPNLDASLRSLMAGANVSLAQFFANGVNTTNAGLDIVVEYNKKFGDKRFKALLAGNLQTMKIDEINVPAKLSGSAFCSKPF